MSSTQTSTNKIAQTINRLTAKTPNRKNPKPSSTGSEYYSGKVIVELPEEVDEVLENSIPQLQEPKSKNTNSTLVPAPVEEVESSSDAIKLMLAKIDKRLDEMDGKIAAASNPSNVEPQTEVLEEEKTVEQQPLLDDEFETLEWMENQTEKLKIAYKVPNDLSPIEVINFVSKEMKKDPDSTEALNSRIHHLVLKYKDVVKQLSPEFNLDEIRSKGYKKLLELSNMESHLLNFALSSGDLVRMFEVAELVRCLVKIQMVYLHEGLNESNFEVADSFINKLLTSNSYMSLTAKAREKDRKKQVVKKATEGWQASSVRGIPKNRRTTYNNNNLNGRSFRQTYNGGYNGVPNNYYHPNNQNNNHNNNYNNRFNNQRSFKPFNSNSNQQNNNTNNG